MREVRFGNFEKPLPLYSLRQFGEVLWVRGLE